MLITLIRTGGIIPMTKTADKVVSWSEEELQELLSVIKKNNDSGQVRDGTEFHLKFSSEMCDIDLEKVPAKYKKIFNEMRDDLKVVRK